MAAKSKIEMSDLDMSGWIESEEKKLEDIQVKNHKVVNANPRKPKKENVDFAKNYMKSNENVSKKRFSKPQKANEVDKAQEEGLPKKMRFLEQVVGGANKPVLVTEENHNKLKYAAQLCDMSLTQLSNNILENFFTSYKKELNEIKDRNTLNF